MGGFVLKLRQWWETADRTQRTVSVGGGIFLVLMIAATFMFASRPHMAMLFGGLSSGDQGSVVAELDKIGIVAEADERGGVMVPSDKVTEARIKLAAAGKLPTNALGDEAFAKLGIMDTPAVEKARLKTILEGQLDETIEAINGIGTAQVHLVLAEDSPFVKDVKPATASVSITERAGDLITKAQGQVIATLVSNSVPGLSINNVAVINNRMEMLFDGSSRDSSGGKIGDKLSAEVAEGKRREGELQAMLDHVFGAQAAIAKVNLELDFDDRSTVTDESEPKKVTRSEQSETMTGSKTGVGGAATVAIGAPSAPSTGAGSEYTRTGKDNEIFVNQTHTELKPSAGSLKTMAIDVIVNSDKVKDTKPVEDIVNGYLGPKKDDKNFTKQVTSVAFDVTAAKAATDAANSASSQQRMQQIISMLPIAALLFVGFLVMKSIGKFSKGTSMALVGGGSLPVPYMPSSLPQSGGDLIRAVERGSSDSGGSRSMIDSGPDDDEADAQLASIKGISRKVNVPLEQIKKMSSDRPETVAMLIKGWLLEER